jgi:hypothetical protein
MIREALTDLDSTFMIPWDNSGSHKFTLMLHLFLEQNYKARDLTPATWPRGSPMSIMRAALHHFFLRSEATFITPKKRGQRRNPKFSKASWTSFTNMSAE